MLFTTIKVLNNQNECWYIDHSVWQENNKEDYDNDKITDADIINERYGCNFSDLYVDMRQCYDNAWLGGEGLYEYRVQSVMDITKDEYATLVKLGLTDSYEQIISLCYFAGQQGSLQNAEEKS